MEGGLEGERMAEGRECGGESAREGDRRRICGRERAPHFGKRGRVEENPNPNSPYIYDGVISGRGMVCLGHYFWRRAI